MKKSVRMICLFLAALLVATTLIGALASIVYGQESEAPGQDASHQAEPFDIFTSSSSSSSSSSSGSSSGSGTSSSSSSTGGGASNNSAATEETGKFRWETYPAFFYRGSNNPTTRLNKNRAYRVSLQFVDNSLLEEDMLEDFPTTSTSGMTAWENYLNVYVDSNGNSNFAVVPHPDYDDDESGIDLDFSLELVRFTKSHHPIFEVSFFVEPDGAGKSFNVNIEYEYKNASGGWDTRAGTLSRTITEVYLSDSSGSESSESSEDESYLIGKPNIIISSYSYGGGQITAGASFPLTIQFENTSPELDLENIILNVTTSTDLAIASGSNSMFFESLGVGEKSQSTFQVSTTVSAKPEPQQITVKFTYEYILNKKRETGERTEVIAIPIVQPDRFSIGELSVPSQIWPGDSTYLTIDYVNKGKTDIYNLAARLETNVPGIGESQNIGNVTAGSSGTIDFTISVNDPGTVSGTVFVTYEDAKGEEKTQELPFTATVMDMSGMGGFEPPVDLPVEPEQQGLSTPAKVMSCAGGLMVAGLVFTLVVKKAKAKRDEASDEDI